MYSDNLLTIVSAAFKMSSAFEPKVTDGIWLGNLFRYHYWKSTAWHRHASDMINGVFV